MVTKKMRIPKKGDRVAVTGRKGTYVVFLVDESIQVADLKQLGSDERLATIRLDRLFNLSRSSGIIPRISRNSPSEADRISITLRRKLRKIILLPCFVCTIPYTFQSADATDTREPSQPSRTAANFTCRFCVEWSCSALK